MGEAGESYDGARWLLEAVDYERVGGAGKGGQLLGKLKRGGRRRWAAIDRFDGVTGVVDAVVRASVVVRRMRMHEAEIDKGKQLDSIFCFNCVHAIEECLKAESCNHSIRCEDLEALRSTELSCWNM